MSAPRTSGLRDDVVQPFQIERPGLRGRLVRLGPAIDTVLNLHDYPEPVACLLAEALALAVALSAALKYEGIFTLQATGDGPVKMLLADVTSGGAIRGYAEIDGDLPAAEEIARAPVPRLIGAGHLAFTVDQGQHTERYQGIVELTGTTLGECVHHYFEQSDQFAAAVRLAAGLGTDGSWRAGALMLQRLPDEAATDHGAAREEDWRRSIILMSSVESAEMLDPALAPADLLYRLFHEDGVRIFKSQQLAFACRCSRERAAHILSSLPRAEVAAMTVDGRVFVTCQFCNSTENFSENQITALFET